MTTSAPQWPDADGGEEREADSALHPRASRSPREVRGTEPASESGAMLGASAPTADRACGDPPGTAPTGAAAPPTDGAPGDLRLVRGPARTPTSAPAELERAPTGAPTGREQAPAGGQPAPAGTPAGTPTGAPAGTPTGTPTAAPTGRERSQGGRQRAGRGRRRFVVVRDPSESELAAARRRARPNLPSPVVVTRDVAMALLEVEAGCRSAAQLERIFSPELWEALEPRIGRRGGPLPSGRSLLSVRYQEHMPGLADTVAAALH